METRLASGSRPRECARMRTFPHAWTVKRESPPLLRIRLILASERGGYNLAESQSERFRFRRNSLPPFPPTSRRYFNSPFRHAARSSSVRVSASGDSLFAANPCSVDFERSRQKYKECREKVIFFRAGDARGNYSRPF